MEPLVQLQMCNVLSIVNWCRKISFTQIVWGLLSHRTWAIITSRDRSILLPKRHVHALRNWNFEKVFSNIDKTLNNFFSNIFKSLTIIPKRFQNSILYHDSLFLFLASLWSLLFPRNFSKKLDIKLALNKWWSEIDFQIKFLGYTLMNSYIGEILISSLFGKVYLGDNRCWMIPNRMNVILEGFLCLLMAAVTNLKYI